jgi:hypothetical protein
MLNFIGQMVQLRDSFAQLASTANLQNINLVYLRRKINNGYEMERIVPDPWVSEVNFDLKTVENLNSIRGMNRVLEIKGVSFKYPRSALEGENIDYQIHEKGEVLSCKLVKITDNGLTWELTVEERIGEQGLYGNLIR